MSQVRQKTKRLGRSPPKRSCNSSCSTVKKFHSDGLREKLREFFREEVSGGNASGSGVKQFGTHHRTAFLQSSARLSCLMKSNLPQKVDLRWSRELDSEEAEQERGHEAFKLECGLCAKLFNLADARDDSARKHLHDVASSLSRRLRWDYRNFVFLYQSSSITSASTGIVYSPAEIPCQHADTGQQ
jgi:hypothetical protein